MMEVLQQLTRPRLILSLAVVGCAAGAIGLACGTGARFVFSTALMAAAARALSAPSLSSTLPEAPDSDFIAAANCASVVTAW